MPQVTLLYTCPFDNGQDLRLDLLLSMLGELMDAQPCDLLVYTVTDTFSDRVNYVGIKKRDTEGSQWHRWSRYRLLEYLFRGTAAGAKRTKNHEDRPSSPSSHAGLHPAKKFRPAGSEIRRSAGPRGLS